MSRVKKALRKAAEPVRRWMAEPDPEAGTSAVDLLVASPLFDDAWYSTCADRPMIRREAVEHYLAGNRRTGISPHPLFAPVYAAGKLGLNVAKYLAEDSPLDDALVVYVRDRRYAVPVHPLFDVEAYLAENPAAAEHPHGPLGHYRETGAAAGARVNGWYEPDPQREPTGLEGRVHRAALGWVERRRTDLTIWGPPKAPAITDAQAAPVVSEKIGTTTVVLVAEHPEADLDRSVQSVLEQTTTTWELLVVGVRDALDAAVLPEDPRIRVVGSAATPWAARNLALAEASGTHVAWMTAGDAWFPGRLSSVHRALLDSGSSWAHDCARTSRGKLPPRSASRPITREALLGGAVGNLGTVISTVELARRDGGFDESLRGAQTIDFLLRLCDDADPGFAHRVGVRMQLARNKALTPHPHDQGWVDFENLTSASDVVINDRLVDWDGLAARQVRDDLVSVLIPTYEDWEMTELAVRRVVEARTPGTEVEIVVIDNGCSQVPSTILDTLPDQYDGVRVVQTVVNYGFALGNNIGLNVAHGATVVFLNNDTEVDPGWLAPLVDALADPEVLGAQSLLIYPDGTIQSAGVVFPRGNGLAHVLLQHFPVEDAVGLEHEPLHALTGAALAMRFSDVVALRGFDPVFRNGMEDIDICLRLEASRPGRFVTLPASRVVHHESKTPGRFAKYAENRQVLLERWAGRLPEDDVEAWGRRGFEVTGHRFAHGGIPDRRLLVAEPILAQGPRVQVSEGVPRLRWAIKNPAPSGPRGEAWGDTHFGAQLADALRRLGQHVAVDRRGSFGRSSEHLDDVTVLLRGLIPYRPLLDRVNLLWLISHPDMMERTEHIGWDRVYVASTTFADRIAREWGAPATSLLQATDPAVFHPDLAQPDTGDQVLFIGNSRGQGRPLVMAAVEQGLPLRVYGAGWEDLIPAEYIAGTFVPNDQVGAAYRSARVVLNDHWEDMARDGFLSNRLFDAVGAGARVISDHVPGLTDVFGDAVQVVRSPEELAAVVNAPDLDALFGDDQVRRSRAAALAAEHSFDHRARIMLDDALRIRSERGFR